MSFMEKRSSVVEELGKKRSNSGWSLVRNHFRRISIANYFLNNLRNMEPLRESEVKESMHADSFGDQISICQFSIAPSILKPPSSKQASDSKHGSNSQDRFSKTYDDFRLQYLQETSNWREMRRKLRLPVLGLNRFSIFDALPANRRMGNLSEQDEPQIENFRCEPTYRLQPVIKVDIHTAESLIHKLLNNYIHNVNVSEVMSSSSSVKASMDHLITSIKKQMKQLLDKRYKIIVSCTATEFKYQGIIVASKCLWDTGNDVCITVKETHKNYIFLVNLFAVYHE